MKSTNCSNSFYNIEQNCEHKFIMGEPFWHLYTDGNQSSIIFTSEADFKVGMNLIAVSAIRHPNVKVYTFTLMNNHVHIIISGNEDKCILFFEEFRSRLQRYFARNGRCVNLNNFTSNIIRITDLKMLRNEIAYVNRNGYSAHSQYTPFSYPWGAGGAYFNPVTKELPKERFCDLPLKTRREICRSREAELPEEIMVHKGIILPSCYCYIHEGESFFRSASHYFYIISKNYEAYSAIAERLHESVFITDEEMFSVAVMLSMKRHNTKEPCLLCAKDKIEIARIMHSEYNANNRQIRNILRLDRGIVDNMFPSYK